MKQDRLQGASFGPGSHLPGEAANASSSQSDFDPSRGAWRPIATAPRDGTWVLVYRHRAEKQDDIEMAQYGEVFRGEMAWRNGMLSFPVEHGPTHWMPLPSAPGIEARQGRDAEGGSVEDESPVDEVEAPGLALTEAICLDKLKKERDELREALRPFAKAGDDMMLAPWRLTAADWARARTLLSQSLEGE